MKSPIPGSRSMAGTRTRISLTLLIPTDITSFVHRSGGDSGGGGGDGGIRKGIMLVHRIN